MSDPVVNDIDADLDPLVFTGNALHKAAYDQFVYAAFIRGFGPVLFAELDRLPEGWVRLKDVKLPEGKEVVLHGFKCGFPRGLDVREKDIVWVADAPYGS